MTFALAMVENEHVWKRAQAEIDAVVGTDRLPEFDDRPSLPYVDAIIREVLRWRSFFSLRCVLGCECPFRSISKYPQGGPHAVMRNDIYKGYFGTLFAHMQASLLGHSPFL